MKRPRNAKLEARGKLVAKLAEKYATGTKRQHCNGADANSFPAHDDILLLAHRHD
jgi:hypothetical protein